MTGAVCAAALGYSAAQPAQPAQNQSLAAWLASRHLSDGLAVNYWVANSTTLDSGARIAVRQVGMGNGFIVRPLPRELQTGWYSPASQYADFYVANDVNPGNSAAEQAAAVRTFGAPAAGAAPGGLHRPGVAQEPAGRPWIAAIGTPVPWVAAIGTPVPWVAAIAALVPWVAAIGTPVA